MRLFACLRSLGLTNLFETALHTGAPPPTCKKLGAQTGCDISANVPAPYRFLLPFGLLVLALLPRVSLAVSEPRLRAHDFTGVQSCQTSGCHGGGVGKNQTIIWEKKDAHAKGHAILSVGRSKNIASAMGIPEASRDARCTVCHSPLESVPPERIAPGVNVEQGVSCEACHGPAEPWLRFHTRKDITRDQRLAAGMREMKDFYNRANTCVACHLYIEPELAKAGHPEMFFELALQQKKEPPHWRDPVDPWMDPRAWLVGQAVSLRELSWRLAERSDEDIAARVEGLRWVLRQTQLGAEKLPASGDPRGTQASADNLARAASKGSWTKETTMAQLRKFAETSAQFRDAKAPKPELLRRAQILLPGMDRFYQALKASGTQSPLFEQSYGVVVGEAKKGSGFDPAIFAGALQQVEVALVQMK